MQGLIARCVVCADSPRSPLFSVSLSLWCSWEPRHSARGAAARMTPPPGAPRSGGDAASAVAAASAPSCDALVPARSHAPPLEATLRTAAWRALGGGLAGGGAMVCNVAALMCAPRTCTHAHTLTHTLKPHSRLAFLTFACTGLLTTQLTRAHARTQRRWLRTALFCQYTRGIGFRDAMRTVYAEGVAAGGGRRLAGVTRFYQGVGYALLLVRARRARRARWFAHSAVCARLFFFRIVDVDARVCARFSAGQAPISRFGDTFCNAGAQALFAAARAADDANAAAPSSTSHGVLAQTAVAAAGSGAFRALIMPLDTVKTMRQVEGARGGAVLLAKIRALGARRALWAGAAGAAGAHAASFAPWFATHNALQAALPPVPRRPEDGAPVSFPLYAARAAGIGLVASCVSDTASNALHVLKTRKQTAAHDMSYRAALAAAISSGGGIARGLLFRGLGTKIAASAANGVLFTVLWNWGQDRLAGPPLPTAHAET